MSCLSPPGYQQCVLSCSDMLSLNLSDSPGPGWSVSHPEVVFEEVKTKSQIASVVLPSSPDGWPLPQTGYVAMSAEKSSASKDESLPVVQLLFTVHQVVEKLDPLPEPSAPTRSEIASEYRANPARSPVPGPQSPRGGKPDLGEAQIECHIN